MRGNLSAVGALQRYLWNWVQGHERRGAKSTERRVLRRGPALTQRTPLVRFSELLPKILSTARPRGALYRKTPLKTNATTRPFTGISRLPERGDRFRVKNALSV